MAGWATELLGGQSVVLYFGLFWVGTGMNR